MSVITLHIFFAGLVAFVPSPDGQKLTVLVPVAGHEHILSDGSHLEPHRALLVARAGGCEADGTPGLCGAADGVANLLFPGELSKAPEELETALLHGAAWELDGMDLSLTPQMGGLQLQDFDQIADLNRLVPGEGFIYRPLLGSDPPPGKLAARLTLSSGMVSPYRLVQQIEGNAPALRFRDLKSGREAASGYSRPLATWVRAEIQIPGNFVELEVRRFGQGDRRKVRLMPNEHDQVEIVVMNVVASRNGPLAKNEPDKHFELYYELTEKKPPFRPVPYIPSGPTVPVPIKTSQAMDATKSDLLAALRLGDARGVYDRLICPVAQLAAGQ